MLLSCGDALIDFVPIRAADGRDAYLPLVGGSCLNVAIAMARLGAPAGFVGGLSTDMFGEMIADHARRSGVDLTHATRSPSETTLAFVRFIEGEPHYAFYDDNTAARRWTYRAGSLPFGRIGVLHLGSTSLIADPAASQMLALARDARGKTTLSFDPNCRPALVTDKVAYGARVDALMDMADIIKLSDADFAFLHGSQDPGRFAERKLHAGTRLVVLTKGEQGVSAWHGRTGRVDVSSPAVNVADTVGAGDTFQAAFLVALRAQKRLEGTALAMLDEAELVRALRYGVRAAAVTCSRPGADPPYRHELPALETV